MKRFELIIEKMLYKSPVLLNDTLRSAVQIHIAPSMNT